MLLRSLLNNRSGVVTAPAARAAAPEVCSPAIEPRCVVVDGEGDDLVSKVITQVQISPERSRLAEHASGGLIHLSNLMDMCPRQVALAGNMSTVGVQLQTVDPNMRIVWAMGRAAEAMVRTDFIAGYGANRVFGDWRCRCGHHHSVGVMGDPDVVCELCGTGENYHEHAIVDSEFSIVGNSDLIIERGSLLEPLEIKSIKGDDFKKLREPIRKHILQAAGYHRMYQKNGYAMHDSVRLLYVSKNTVKGPPYREFIVPVRQDWIQARLDAMWDVAAQIRRYREEGILPPRTCPDMNSVVARNCPTLVSCFSR